MRKQVEQRGAIRKVGLTANTEKAAGNTLAAQAARLIARACRKVLADAATAECGGFDAETRRDVAGVARDSDLLIVCGGDGTMLRVARDTAGCKTPILGINAGALGFLTDISAENLASALDRVWAGDFNIDSRALLSVTGIAKGQAIRQEALNDIVISRGPVSRLIELDVTVDGELLTRYRCDGLIVSTPTGSTAYSLAAGGAIVKPDADVITLTPICPHTLSNRSVIVSLRAVVQVRVASARLETMLSADGQVQHHLGPGDEVFIRRSRRVVNLVRLSDQSFFDTLRRKLRWSGTNVP